MSSGGFQPVSGFWNRRKGDQCVYQQDLQMSTSPLSYMTYQGAYENCSKCIYEGQFNVPYAPEIIDIDSELKNITRPLSDCNQLKYSPNCKRSGMCVSTFDRSAPVVLAPEVCPIIYNNILRRTSNGIVVPPQNPCRYK